MTESAAGANFGGGSGGGAGGSEALLIRSDPPCRKCRRTKVVLEEIAAAHAGLVSLREITMDDPEAEEYGAVLTPMVVLNGKIICAGLAPVKAGLEKLLAAALGQE